MASSHTMTIQSMNLGTETKNMFSKCYTISWKSLTFWTLEYPAFASIEFYSFLATQRTAWKLGVSEFDLSEGF